ncbi:peptidase M19 renal dipeptidase [Bacillus freudenreichii]|nr:peptidase M19 renal dipeptidase [Bacillus freudenreichii]
MNVKKYDGYRSFNYLEPGKDYREYELSCELDRVPRFTLELTVEEEKVLQEILEKEHIVSLRDHGFITPKKYRDIIPYCRQLHTHFHYEGIARSGIDVIFENFMDGISLITSKNGLKWDDVIYLLGIRYADIQKQETVYIASDFQDIRQVKENRQTALLPSLEAASALENEVDRVDILYGFGIRCMGITYNQSNTLGSGLGEEVDGGLTHFGRKVIERMNRLGMMIDISHCGDRTSLDVIEASEQPVLITHAGARALWNTPRMKSDKVLKACAEKGGIIGVCAAPNTTLTRNHPEHSIYSVMEHFAYLVELVGIDHVGLGPDTFFGDHAAIQHAFDEMLGIADSHSGEEFQEASYVKGLENPAEAMKNMIGWMVKEGYAHAEIIKAAGGNAMRVMEEILS